MDTRFASNAYRYFFIWGICASLATTVCTIVDALLVGNLIGNHGLAVANLSTPVFLLYALVGITLGVGANVQIGRKLGAADIPGANRIFHSLLTAGLMIGFQWLCGVGVAYGGRRTGLGQTALEQTLALKRHMRRVTKAELQRILKSNPGYFHELAPYALALGMDRTFAKRFGRLRLPECTYLVGGTGGQLSALEWTEKLRRTVSILDAKAQRLPFEKLTGR